MLPALLVCRGVWSVEDLEKFEEGVARWGLSSPDAIIALLPSRPPYFAPPPLMFYFISTPILCLVKYSLAP